MTQVTVRLTTTQLSSPVAITEFQFGTIPAPAGSYTLVADLVAPGETAAAVFWLDPEVAVPTGQEVRYNLRFELNIHNSANLQLRLSPSSLGVELDWRWSAPIGFKGAWSAAEQQAPWFDDGMDYCITIQPDKTDVAVALAEHPAVAKEMCAVIPAQDSVEAMRRGASPQAQ